jgi:hypothetical protein
VSHSATYLDYYPAMADEDDGMRPEISFDEGAFECEGDAIMAPLTRRLSIRN